MNKKLTLLACGLLALAGCATDSTPLGNASSNTSSNSSGGSGSSASSTGSGSASSSSGGMASTAAAGSPGMQSTGGVVQSIEQITRQDAMALGLSTAAAAAGGAMGSPTEKIYRITVRLDDGSTQTVLAESMPSYKNGERVRYANGIVTRE